MAKLMILIMGSRMLRWLPMPGIFIVWTISFSTGSMWASLIDLPWDSFESLPPPPPLSFVLTMELAAPSCWLLVSREMLRKNVSSGGNTALQLVM